MGLIVLSQLPLRMIFRHTGPGHHGRYADLLYGRRAGGRSVARDLKRYSYRLCGHEYHLVRPQTPRSRHEYKIEGPNGARKRIVA